jgi:hypothetical protein
VLRIGPDGPRLRGDEAGTATITAPGGEVANVQIEVDSS